ncbi:hypothetical protein NKG05_19025 [Oerskovia sp. M15]
MVVTTRSARACSRVMVRWAIVVAKARAGRRWASEPVMIPLGRMRSGQASRISTTRAARKIRASAQAANMLGIPGTVPITTVGRTARRRRRRHPRWIELRAATRWSRVRETSDVVCSR